MELHAGGKQSTLPALRGIGSADKKRDMLEGGEGNTSFRPYSEPEKTLTQLGQPTQLNQHRDIGMQHPSFRCSLKFNRNRA